VLCALPGCRGGFVQGVGHAKAVDYWSLGILIYEMITGYSPFVGDNWGNTVVICQNIITNPLTFPEVEAGTEALFTPESEDLCRHLLQKEPSMRLGCLKGGTRDVKDHGWFQGVDWHAMLAKKVQAPWLPTVTNPLDTSNFDHYGEMDPIIPYDGPQEWCANF
jgi:serine/threonine protein kinase